MRADPAATALFLSAFFDELTRWGVRDVVVSPGSRSTPLTMTAYELSCREPRRLRLYVDVDERGAAFFALGLAKASGRPTALICTSGTAVANYYPAVMEAESSRVPLVVLTGDRPPRLQGLGAPQTCDQLKAFSDHVRMFRQMPQPEADAAAIAFARQAAREACIAAGGEALGDSEGATAPTKTAASPQRKNGSDSTMQRLAGACMGGPVHLNFPFEEPLKPDFSVEGLFETGRTLGLTLGKSDAPVDMSVMRPSSQLGIDFIQQLMNVFDGQRTLVLAGEGSCTTNAQAQEVLAFACALEVPLLADPLSGLRTLENDYVIDNYDTVLGNSSTASSLAPQVVIRFGRFPVSKRATTFISESKPFQIVVDPFETRDFIVHTNLHIACSPIDFVRGVTKFLQTDAPSDTQRQARGAYVRSWVAANVDARNGIVAAKGVAAGFEGAFVQRMVELVPPGSCLFAGNSMSIRALDTFYLKNEKHLCVLCNRGLNGIDGTVSTALGAAQNFAQTTLVVGDLALLHDLNALALQREILLHHGDSEIPRIVIVLLNNNGGAIFDMLPQKSEESYFERLFLTPQDVNFEAAAAAFKVPYRAAETVADFDVAYRELLEVVGISLLEVRLPLEGLKERYAPYWDANTSDQK